MTTAATHAPVAPPSPWRRHLLAGGLLAAAAVGAVMWTVLANARAGAAAPFSGEVVSGTLFVRGSDGDDTIVLRLASGDANTLEVDFANDGSADLSFDRTTFTSIKTLGMGGVDLLQTFDGNGVFTDTELTYLDGGSGNDTLIGGIGAEILQGQGGNDFVDGNRGDDLALLGGGADIVQWDPGDGSDTLEGQAGVDTLDFNGANIGENINVAANGSRVRFTRDVANITMDLDGMETIGFDAVGGADIVTVGDLAGTAARTVAVNLAAFGGGGDAQPDDVVVNGTGVADLIDVKADGPTAVVEGLAAETRVTGGEPALDEMYVNGLGGMDSIEGTPATGAIVNAVFDGGDGLDASFTEGTLANETFQVIANGLRARVTDGGTGFFEVANAESFVIDAKGGADDLSTSGNVAAILPYLNLTGGGGNDVILGGNGADILVGGGGSDFVDGQQGADLAFLGGGADVFQWDPGDGLDTVEGEDGTDALQFNGANIGENIDVSANGSRVRFFRDVANVTLDLNGVETIDFDAVGGADIVTVNDLSGTSARTVDVDLTSLGAGDGQPDRVIVNGTAAGDLLELRGAAPAVTVKGLPVTPLVTGVEPGDEMVLDGGGGNDMIKVVPGNAPMTVVADGGGDTDTVFADGTGASDTFSVIANGARARVHDTLNQYFEVGPVETLQLNGKGGNDSFASSGNIAALLPSVVFDGGGGNDTILGTNGTDILIGGGGADFVDGQQGDDLALLGTGADTFQWDPGDGLDTVEGQDGTDTLLFNGANIGEIIDISANGSRVRFSRNIANIVLDLDGVETIDFDAVGGADIVTVGDLTGTATKTVNVDLQASIGGGDAAADQVVVNGPAGADVITVTGAGTSASVKGLSAAVNVTGAELANDRLDVQTGDGTDVVDSAGLAPGVIQLYVDGLSV